MTLSWTRVFFILFICSTIISAQEDSKIIGFDGGKIDFSLNVAGGLFSGISGSAANTGGSIAAFEPDGGTGFWNPANLAAINKLSLFVDFIPPAGFSLNSIMDIDAEIQVATDDAIKDYRDAALQPIYSKLASKIYQKDQVNAFVFTFPHSLATFSAYYFRPFDLSLSSAVSGVQAQILAQLAATGGDDKVLLNSYVDGHFDFNVGINAVGFAAGRQINPDWRVGLALERYDARIRTKGLFNIDGTMVFGGKENTFNDPNDSWHNDLNQFIDADYRGSDWGWKIAATYHVNPDFQVNAVFHWTPNVTTSGYMTLVNNTIPALNLDLLGEQSDEQEILDPAKLKLSQLTLTEQVDNKVYPELEVRLPKMLRLGGAYRYHWLAVHFNYSLGLSPLSFVYGEDEIGLKPSHTFLLGFDLKYVQTGFGLSILHKKARGSKNLGSDGVRMQVPLFTLGTHINVGKNIRLYLSLQSLPLPSMKMSFNYQF